MDLTFLCFIIEKDYSKKKKILYCHCTLLYENDNCRMEGKRKW